MSTVSTITTAPIGISLARPSKSNVRFRRVMKRRLSAPQKVAMSHVCTSMSPVEAIDLTKASPTQALASLRFLVLSYLADLEQRLSEFESPNVNAWISKGGELSIEDASQWSRTALDMLNNIRSDVYSHFPEMHFADLSSVERFINAYLPDLPDMKELRGLFPDMPAMRSHLPDVADMRTRLPDMPHLPDMAEVRSHLPDMPHLPHIQGVRSHLPDFTLADVRHKLETRFHELDFQKPLSYIPTLSDHLQTLQSHLSATPQPPSGPIVPTLAQSTLLAKLLDALSSSELVTEILGPVVEESTVMKLEQAAKEVAHAMKQSVMGTRLIEYSDLPRAWRNNHFVVTGYRFIPRERWHLLLASIFTCHNETLNIHTHLIPFLLWSANLMSAVMKPDQVELPEVLFMFFASLCLLGSTIAHTMSGCAHNASMVFCSRVDYVGIGWLITTTIGTIVYYSLRCHPFLCKAFLGLCILIGIAGNIFPFMAWFDEREYRSYRVAFFLSMAFSGLGPLIAVSTVYSWREAINILAIVGPSLISYVIGLIFYITHFPECILSEGVRRKLNFIGCGSHSIWHCFIILAVTQHQGALQVMNEGNLQCAVS